MLPVWLAWPCSRMDVVTCMASLAVQYKWMLLPVWLAWPCSRMDVVTRMASLAL